jgi:hypothetical protein
MAASRRRISPGSAEASMRMPPQSPAAGVAGAAPIWPPAASSL